MKRVLIVLVVITGAVALIAAVVALAGPSSSRYVVPGLAAGIGAAIGIWWAARRARRQQATIEAAHPDAAVIGSIFPFPPVREALAALQTAAGRTPSTTRYGSLRPLVTVEAGTLSVRLHKGDELLAEVPASSVKDLAARELKVGLNKFLTLDLTIEAGGTTQVLPLPFTKPGAPTEQPTREQFSASMQSLHAALWPKTP